MDNKIIMYEGGGYSGCFWEYNAVLMHEGTLHDIYTSGRDGVPLFTGSDTPVSDKGVIADALKHIDQHSSWEVDLSSQESIDNLTDRVPASFTESVLQLAECITDENYDVKCSMCKEHVPLSDTNMSSPHGCGGIVTCCDDYICEDCYNMGSCPWCNEYVTREELGAHNACEDCIKIALAGTEAEARVEELRDVITAGAQQVDVLCQLQPEREPQLRGTHKEQCIVLNAEIDALIQAALKKEFG